MTLESSPSSSILCAFCPPRGTCVSFGVAHQDCIYNTARCCSINTFCNDNSYRLVVAGAEHILKSLELQVVLHCQVAGDEVTVHTAGSD